MDALTSNFSTDIKITTTIVNSSIIDGGEPRIIKCVKKIFNRYGLGWSRVKKGLKKLGAWFEFDPEGILSSNAEWDFETAVMNAEPFVSRFEHGHHSTALIGLNALSNEVPDMGLAATAA